MMVRRVKLVALVAAVATGACRRSNASSNAAGAAAGAGTVATAADSVQGIIAVTGTAFDQHLVLQAAGRSTTLGAVAADSAALTRLGGVEVMVFGHGDGAVFRVTRFEARRVSGAPVVDGVIRLEGERVELETAGGRVALGNPPDALKGMGGARVWVGGPMDVGPNSYGVIVPKP